MLLFGVFWHHLEMLRFIMKRQKKVFAQGIVAGIGNAVTVAIAGTLLLLAYSRTQTRSGSLKKD